MIAKTLVVAMLLASHFVVLLQSYRHHVPPGAKFYSRFHSSTAGSDSSNVEFSRSSLVRIIESSWSHVTRLLPQSTLSLCESELKDATSLLVLATVRKSADENPQSRSTVAQMFKEADVNNDGQVSFSEWFDWLGSGSDNNSGDNDTNNNGDDNGLVNYNFNFNYNYKDPIISALSSVLGHAVCTLKVVSRLKEADPSLLSAAFIAGGTMAGVMDAEVSSTMLSRLSPATRELVTLALSLEAASTPLPIRMQYDSNSITSKASSSSSSSAAYVPVNKASFDLRSRDVDEGKGAKVASTSLLPVAQDRSSTVIQTIDLSSIPALSAPPISDNGAAPASTGSGLALVRRPVETAPALAGADSSFDGVLRNAGIVMNDILKIRESLRDLDDNQAFAMRQILLTKGRGRIDVMGLAMALRSTRLQHATRLPTHLKQQLAIETLQLWAPLSYQVSLSSKTPELEVHSYVLLFPQSFGSFINWYTQFRPSAKLLLRQFRNTLEMALKNDKIMPTIATNVLLQSRLKTASSAFKKMVKGAKVKNELFDMLGMRVIVTNREKEPQDFFSDGVVAYSEDGDSASSAATSLALPQVADKSPSNNVGGVLEERAIWRLYDIITTCSSVWKEDRRRFKDYVNNPKKSGYQSLHLCLVHLESGVKMEIQIRTSAMHIVAEFGSASHTNYKALLLPPGKKR